jgi:hypothetical protein
VSDPGAIAALHGSLLAQFPALDTLVRIPAIVNALSTGT